jgi:tetratricopeptide (TPR) repeat protein
MLGIVCPPEEALEWNHKAIQIAEGATDERARGWLGSLLNNTAWTIHDQGRPEEALELFEKALAFRLERGNPKTIRIARWCVGRCLRSLGRIDEALRMQRDLMSEGDEAGYGSEEIGECLLALGRVDEAKPHFARASELLSKDEWLVANEPARIERLRALS